MSIFNSLGSNYTYSSALRILFSAGGAKAQKELEDYLERRYGGSSTSLGASKAILTYKGREALSLALSVLPKGKIAINGFTCIAVYEAIVQSGHEPLYLDIDNDSLNFSFETLRNSLVQHDDVRAVVIQNTLGFPCDVAPIAQMCKARGIVFIEDLAHSIGTRYADGREAGTIGDFVVFSFSQDKVVDAVSGGALIIRNPKFAAVVTNPTKNVAQFQQIKDCLYPILTWKIRTFYSFGPGKLLHRLYRSLRLLSTPFANNSGEAHMLPGWYCANILRGFGQLDQVAKHRKNIAEIYYKGLAFDKGNPLRVDVYGSSNLRFPILIQERSQLIEYLRSNKVYISDIWYDAPIAPKKYLRRTNYADQCPNAEKISDTILNLPTHINVSLKDASRIVELVNRCGTIDSQYTVRAMHDEYTWEKFLAEQKPHSFLHSWKWGEQYMTTGQKVFRFGVYQDQTLTAIGLFIKIVARRGSFLLCPHGPIVAKSKNEKGVLELLMQRAEEIAKEEHCDFIRICPLSKPSDVPIYRHMGFHDAPIHMHPELAWMLDITKSEDDLLREMRKTTRYTIKKMEKPARLNDVSRSGGEGVEITQSTNPNDIERFWPVYQATVERQHFTPFKKNDLWKEFELFSKDNQAAFFFGKQNGTIVAAAIIIFYNGQAFYHHSGSLASGSNVSYLLQWRVIQEAKRRGCTLYNFWGISPPDKPTHPWVGLSLFKKGFGGFAEGYLHAQDKPLTAKYWLNYLIETMRRIKRGL